jgi:hypothetical protein
MRQWLAPHQRHVRTIRELMDRGDFEPVSSVQWDIRDVGRLEVRRQAQPITLCCHVLDRPRSQSAATGVRSSSQEREVPVGLGRSLGAHALQRLDPRRHTRASVILEDSVPYTHTRTTPALRWLSTAAGVVDRSQRGLPDRDGLGQQASVRRGALWRRRCYGRRVGERHHHREVPTVTL